MLARTVLAAFVALEFSACVLVPPPDPISSGPNVDQVVRRVKCDLVTAIAPLLRREKNTWLQTWTAQASLTYIVNDAVTLTPGATFTQPLTTESLPLRVANASRSWNFGLGAGYNTTASRNETLSFSVSLQEIKDQGRANPGSEFCNYPTIADIQSELGLKEWIASALTPVAENSLTPGHHKTKSGNASPSSSSSSTKSSSGGANANLASFVTTPNSLIDISKALATVTAKFSTPTNSLLPPDVLDQQAIVQGLVSRITAREIYDPTTQVATSVSGVFPTKGSSAGGTRIVITGNNFIEQNGVTIGGIPVDPDKLKVASDSTICAVAPKHDATPSNAAADVVVNTPDGAAAKTQAFTFDDKSLISVDPPSGDISTPPTSVTIFGTDFTNATGVTFGGQPVPQGSWSIDPHNPGIIHAAAPKNNPGVVDVVVNMPQKTNPHDMDFTGAGFFTYYDAKTTSAPPACPSQATTKKKVIAYVDERLNRDVNRMLFESHKLILLAERYLALSRDDDQKVALNAVLQTAKALEDAIQGLQLDPPVDAIAHQVQFIIVYNASASPSWTLLHFKGPSPGSGSLASASATLTHTLNIAIGPPGSADVANTLGALQIGTAVGNAISTGAPIP